MIIRSRAPLRIGLAGGGTDIEAYSSIYGGAVVNATINMYAYCTIVPRNDGKIIIDAIDNNRRLETDATPVLDIDGDNLILHRGVYNRIVKDYNGGKPLSFHMSTSNDAPVGSGLGTSSAMVVALIEAFSRLLNLNLSKEEKAQLAYDIERNDLKLAGGKQDQYASVYGGFNYMTFKKDGKVSVEKIEISDYKINELETSLLLFYGGKSRSSSKVQLELAKNVINTQIKGAKGKEEKTSSALLGIKELAENMNSNLKKGSLSGFAEDLRTGWELKKKTSSFVSNDEIESIIKFVTMHGAEAVKISGAGGGGFLLMYFNPVNRQRLIENIGLLDGKVYGVSFNAKGVESWVEE